MNISVRNDYSLSQILPRRGIVNSTYELRAKTSAYWTGTSYFVEKIRFIIKTKCAIMLLGQLISAADPTSPLVLIVAFLRGTKSIFII